MWAALLLCQKASVAQGGGLFSATNAGITDMVMVDGPASAPRRLDLVVLVFGTIEDAGEHVGVIRLLDADLKELGEARTIEFDLPAAACPRGTWVETVRTTLAAGRYKLTFDIDGRRHAEYDFRLHAPGNASP